MCCNAPNNDPTIPSFGVEKDKAAPAKGPVGDVAGKTNTANPVKKTDQQDSKPVVYDAPTIPPTSKPNILTTALKLAEDAAEAVKKKLLKAVEPTETEENEPSSPSVISRSGQKNDFDIETDSDEDTGRGIHELDTDDEDSVSHRADDWNTIDK